MNTRRKTILLCTLLPLAFACLYMFLCSLNLKSSIWFDESYSAYLVRGDFGQIWSETAQDVHPPLFYFLLKIWSGIFGTSDFAMRFMSVFFGALSIILAFHLLKRWFGIKTASVATALLSLSPFLIRYGQEMRMYTLVLAIVLGATYALNLALETKRKRYYILYAVLLSLGMWTHYFTALVWLAHVVYLTAIKKINIFKKPFIYVYLLAVALYLPWIPAFFAQTGEVQAGFWIPGMTFSTLPDFFSEITMFRETAAEVDAWPAFLLIIWLVIFGIFLYRAIKTAGTKEKSITFSSPKRATKLSIKKADFMSLDRDHLFFLFLIIFVPVVLLFLLSLPPLSPMFISRYLIPSAVLIFALVGLLGSLNWKKSRLLAAVFLAATLGLEIVGIVNVENREPLGYSKEIVELIRSVADEGEPTVLKDSGLQEYDFSFYSTEAYPIYIVDEWTDYPWGSMHPLRDYRSTTIDRLSDLDAEKFWLVAGVDANPLEILDEKKYEVVTTLSNSHHLAIEYKKK